MDMSRIEREKRVVGMMVCIAGSRKGTIVCARSAGLCWSMRMPVWSIVRLENVKLRVNIVKYIAINPVCGRKCGR